MRIGGQYIHNEIVRVLKYVLETIFTKKAILVLLHAFTLHAFRTNIMKAKSQMNMPVRASITQSIFHAPTVQQNHLDRVLSKGSSFEASRPSTATITYGQCYDHVAFIVAGAQ